MRPQRCRAVSDRYNHHLVDRARNQNNTKHRRRALHSHRGRKNPAAVGRLAVPPGARAHIATTKQHPPTPKQAPHALGARTKKGTTISPNIMVFVRPFISGCHTVWGCFVNFSRSRKQSKSSKKPETSKKLQTRADFWRALLQFSRSFGFLP